MSVKSSPFASFCVFVATAIAVVQASAGELKALLIPRDQIEIVAASEFSAELQKLLLVERNGKSYVRVFIDPAEESAWRTGASGVLADETPWRGEDTRFEKTSVLFSRADGQELQVKVGLNSALPGDDFKIDRFRARRGVEVSAYLRDLAEKSRGKLEHTEKTWKTISQSVAIGLKSDPSRYTVMQNVPAGSRALIGEWDDAKFEELFRASGHASKLEFVWLDVVQPLLELEAKLRFENGLVTKTHEDSTAVEIDRATGKITGLVLRDTDVIAIDYLARKNDLHLPVPEGGLTFETIETYRYAKAWETPMIGYELLKDSILKSTLAKFLSREEARELIARSNALMLTRFNEKIGGATTDLEISSKLAKRVADRSKPEEVNAIAEAARRQHKKTPLVQRTWGASMARYYRWKQNFEPRATALRCENVFAN